MDSERCFGGLAACAQFINRSHVPLHLSSTVRDILSIVSPRVGFVPLRAVHEFSRPMYSGVSAFHTVTRDGSGPGGQFAARFIGKSWLGALRADKSLSPMVLVEKMIYPVGYGDNGNDTYGSVEVGARFNSATRQVDQSFIAGNVIFGPCPATRMAVASTKLSQFAPDEFSLQASYTTSIVSGYLRFLPSWLNLVVSLDTELLSAKRVPAGEVVMPVHPPTPTSQGSTIMVEAGGGAAAAAPPDAESPGAPATPAPPAPVPGAVPSSAVPPQDEVILAWLPISTLRVRHDGPHYSAGIEACIDDALDEDRRWSQFDAFYSASLTDRIVVSYRVRLQDALTPSDGDDDGSAADAAAASAAVAGSPRNDIGSLAVRYVIPDLRSVATLYLGDNGHVAGRFDARLKSGASVYITADSKRNLGFGVSLGYWD